MESDPEARTSASLLGRLQSSVNNETAWNEFVGRYGPKILGWCRYWGLQEADATDVTQEVLTALVRKLRSFRYDPGRSFRGWMRAIALNKWRERCRRRAAGPEPVGGSAVAAVADSTTADPFDEAEYRQQLVRRALEIMQAEFEPTTWKACWEFVVSGRPAAAVADELGVSVAVVYGAKSRVLRRLRQELDGLLD